MKKNLNGKFEPTLPPCMNLLVRQLDAILSSVGYLRANLGRLGDEELTSRLLGSVNYELNKIIDSLKPLK